MKTEEIQSKLALLSSSDQELVLVQLDYLFKELEIDVLAIQEEIKESESRHCPHCSSSKTVKSGKEHGVQRFLCRGCKHSFRASTGSFNARFRKGKGELLKLYLRHFLTAKSIRYCAAACGITVATSFKWRHRILSALQKQQDSKVLEGIVESDDVFVAYSQKGQRNLERPGKKRGKGMFEPKSRGISDQKVAIIISNDRKGSNHLQVATRGRISENNLTAVLKDKIVSESILCSDSHPSYIAFAKSNKIEHKTIRAKDKKYVKEGKYHIQHVNQSAKELKEWLEIFNGVSTKYLQNYLNWFSVKKRLDNDKVPLKKLSILLCSSWQAIQCLKNIPNLSYI